MTEIGHKTQFSIWQMTFNIQQHRRDVFYKEPCNTSNNWWNYWARTPKIYSKSDVIAPSTAYRSWYGYESNPTQHNPRNSWTRGCVASSKRLALLQDVGTSGGVAQTCVVLWDMGTLRTHLTILPPLRRCRTEDGPWGRYARRVVVRYIVTNFSCGVDLLLARRAIEVILKGLSTILPLDPSPYHTLPYHTMPCTYHPFALLFLGPNMICTLRQPIVSINNNFIW